MMQINCIKSSTIVVGLTVTAELKTGAELNVNEPYFTLEVFVVLVVVGLSSVTTRPHNDGDQLRMFTVKCQYIIMSPIHRISANGKS